jgi:nitroreductase
VGNGARHDFRPTSEETAMGATTLDRTATTDHPVLEVLAGRWSPRAYDADTAIDETLLASALEAARWTPSAYNIQPWRFIVARRGTAEHAAIVETLIGFNQQWAPAAAVLIVAIAETQAADGSPITHAAYDLGQAVAHLSVQAHHDGLVVHQMSGFDAAAVRERFPMDERFVPLTVIALGELGDAGALPEVLREREAAPRVRRPLADSVIVNA